MTSDEIKQLLTDGVDFDLNITARVKSKKLKDTTILFHILDDMCAKIKKDIKILNEATEVKISIKNIKTTPIEEKVVVEKPLPRYPWRRKGLVYQPVEGLPNIQYTTLRDILIVEYDKMHFKTTWEEVQRLSQLPDSELHRNKLHVKLNSKGVTGLLIFINAVKEGKVKIPDNAHKQVVETTPEEVSKDKINLGEIKFTNIPNEKFMSFGIYKDFVVVRLGDITVTTSWSEVDELSKLSHKIMKDRIFNKFPKSVGSRNTLALFVSMYKEGRFTSKDDWSNVKAVAVRGAPDFSYKTKGDKLLLHRNGISLTTDWNLVIKLSQYHKERLIEEISKLNYTGYNSTILFDFVVAYNEARAIDPDAGFRKMLSPETTTGYDGSKIEGTLEE
jgi:hypothetical protein